MTNAKRGRGTRRGFYLCTVAALGLALSACGGGGGGSGASPSQASSGANLPTNNSAVTLNWAPPTENTDGSPLTNLSGYEIYYGTSSGNYSQSVSVSNAGLATYVVDNLSPGTYYFTVSAVNADGTQSPMSSEVSATVN